MKNLTVFVAELQAQLAAKEAQLKIAVEALKNIAEAWNYDAPIAQEALDKLGVPYRYKQEKP